MAKSKRKRRKQPQPTFYEAIPASAPPPGLPLAPDQLQLTFQTLAEFYRTFVEYLTPLRKRALTMFTEAGLATSDTIIRSGRQSLLAARFATDATITYGPSIAADIFGYARRLRLRLFGRQARKLYLMGAGFAAAAGIALGVTAASSTLKSSL